MSHKGVSSTGSPWVVGSQKWLGQDLVLDLLPGPPDQPLLYPDSETFRCQTVLPAGECCCSQLSLAWHLFLAEKLAPLT